MSWRRASGWIIGFAVLAIVGTGGLNRLRADGGGDDGGASGLTTAPRTTLQARVTRVVDGDTIVVAIDGHREKVRYIGIDTPETKKPDTPVQCFGKAASHENQRLVDHQEVRLLFDAEARDRYGRLLAYVYRAKDGVFVNAELVRRGFAMTLTFPPNVRFASLFSRLARDARRAGRGLWSRC